MGWNLLRCNGLFGVVTRIFVLRYARGTEYGAARHRTPYLDEGCERLYFVSSRLVLAYFTYAEKLTVMFSE
jgi:hypothetical protein